MTQFRLPDQVPVTWARINQSGEGGTNAMHMDGAGTDVYNYLMYTQLLPAPANVSLQTRLRAKLVNMTVGNASFEGAAVRHRGFRMTGTEPNLELDTQVWDSNPNSGGRQHWISGNTSDFKDYSFIVSMPPDKGVDYVTWELVMRSPGQIIVSNVECRHFYGQRYELNINGFGRWEESGGALKLERIETASSLDNDSRSFRYVRYLMTEDIDCRKGQNIITSANGIINGRAEHNTTGEVPATSGFSLKLRRKGTSTEDWFDVVERYAPQALASYYDEARQRRARYDYDRAQLIVYVEPSQQGNTALGIVKADYVLYADPQVDLTISDFVAPSQ